MRKSAEKNLTAAVLFFSFMYLQFIILRFGNQAGRGFMPSDKQELVYVFLQVFVISGFVLFFLAKTFIKAPLPCRIITLSAVGAAVPGAAFMVFFPSDSAFYLTVTALTVFFLGVFGGAVYERMASYTAAGIRVGLCMSVGYSAALLLQYLIQLKWLIKPLIAVFAAVCFAALFTVLLKEPEETENREDGKQSPRKLVFVCVIAAALLLFTAFYSGYIHHLQIASGYTEYNVYTWPRLLMIPGMLLLGFAGDVKKGVYLPLAALCVALAALLNAALLGRSETYLLNMCLYYISLSAAVAYYDLTFWRIAARSKRRAAVACIGRLLDSAIVIPVCFIPISELPSGVVLSLNIIALAVILILMSLNGDLNIGKHASETKAPPAPDPSDALTAIGGKYGLTPAETKVLRELVLTEDKQVAIAERLSIKVRTVQANVTSIYRKTGVSTRSGLVQLYNDADKNA